VNFKDKACECFFVCGNFSFVGHSEHRVWGNVAESVKKLVHSETVDGTSEKNRGDSAGKVILFVKRVIYTFDQRHILSELFCKIADMLIKFFLEYVFDSNDVSCNFLRIRFKKIEVLFVKIVNAFECFASADRPGEGTHFYVELCFDLVKKFKRGKPFTVELIYENDDRSFPHPAHIHQPFSL